MNAIETSIFNNLFASLCEEMGASLARSAFSPNIKDRRDYSCALFDSDGWLVGQACHIPVHLGAMAYAVRSVVEETVLCEGDVLILNDPFRGGTHLPDVTVIEAVFYEGQRVGYVANRAHHADIGGTAPGSMPLARHIDEEGLLLEPTLLVRSSRICSDVIARLREAVRTPDEREGDLRAQLAALTTGKRRLSSLVERYGPAAIREAASTLQDVAERYMRSALDEISDGCYRFCDRLDGDGLDDGERGLPVNVSLTIQGDVALIDFEGTAGPCATNLNAPLPVTVSSVLYVFRCLLDIDCPSNSGLLRPLEVSVPKGCLLDAQYPSAVAAGNVETSQRIVDAMLGALAQALPERVPAASCGSMNNVAIGGIDGDGRPFAYYETIAGGAGAHPSCNGRSAIHTHMTNTLNTPIESLEHHYPLKMVRYALRRGSGGPGKHQGGDGVVRELETTVDATVSLLTERRLRAPYGLAGGGSGQMGKNVIVAVDGRQRDLGDKGVFSLAPGERLRIETPGGGGWGTPL